MKFRLVSFDLSFIFSVIRSFPCVLCFPWFQYDFGNFQLRFLFQRGEPDGFDYEMEGLARQFVLHSSQGRIQLEVVEIESHLKVFPALELVSRGHRNKATGEIAVGVLCRNTEVDWVCGREAAGD
jgi:hypothetical protein